MISFKNDYTCGAHPSILQALIDHNDTQQPGYGDDDYTKSASRRIKDLLGHSDAQIHFLSGGTQTNLLAIASFLKPYEACISAHTGHINTHESGAVEGSGHKIIALDSDDGKLGPEQILATLIAHTDEHTVVPKMVYISNPTELGTVYYQDELKELHKVCQAHDLILYCDGARLGQTLILESNGLSLADYGQHTDIFFIGGTKNGALLGEALIINKPNNISFRHMLKRYGGLLAKGRILGITFDTLLQNNLYEDLARHAQKSAQKMAAHLRALGIPFLTDSPTNQIFPILPNQWIESLQASFEFYIWQAGPQESAIRLVTAWDTPGEHIDSFCQVISQIKNTNHI